MSINTRIVDGSGEGNVAQVTNRNALVIDNVAPYPTFMIGTGPFTPPATPTDMVTISASGLNTVLYIQRIVLFTTQTTIGANTFFLKRYNTLTTGGTSTTVTPVDLDGNNLASQAVVKYYTANPTLGNLVGILDQAYTITAQPTGGSATPSNAYIWDFTSPRIQPIVLRTPQDQLSLNFNGAALPTGLKVSVSIIWTEASTR